MEDYDKDKLREDYENYAVKILQYRRLRVYFLILFFFLLIFFEAIESLAPFFLLFVIEAILGTWITIWPCPRCDEPFNTWHYIIPSWRGLCNDRCIHCKLPIIYSDKKHFALPWFK